MSGKSAYFRDEHGNLLHFEQIYDLYFDEIFRHILRRVGQVAEAEDLTAQTFEKVLQALGRFRFRGTPLSAWVYRIATNEVNSYFRKLKHRQAPPPTTETPSSLLSPEQELAEAEQELEKNHLFVALTACIRELKPIDQSLIVMRYLEKKSFSEIAQILKKRRGSVITRTHRALAKLKLLLEKRGIDDERFRKSIAEPASTTYSSGSVQAEFAR